MLDQLQGVSQALGAAVWTMLLVLKWFHAQLVLPAGRLLADGVLPVYEESIKVGGHRWELPSAGRGGGGSAQPAPAPSAARLPPAPPSTPSGRPTTTET